MRPPDTTPDIVDAPLGVDYVDELRRLLVPFGVTHVGVAPAEVLHRAHREITARLADGFTDGMQFTFKNPERSTDPQQAVRGARSILVAARPYLVDDRDVPAPTGITGRIARYAWLDHYAPLRSGLWAVAHRLRGDGWKAVPFADDNSIVDREVAHLAGLGWFGKNANLLVPGAGSWFVLGCVVTTAPLPLADGPVADGCGTCNRCLDACPTGAIVAPGVVDAGRCIAWRLQKPGIVPRDLRVAFGDRIYGCDDCQEACPPTVRMGHRYTASVSAGETPRSTVDVDVLLALDDEPLVEHWGRWYLADRDPRWARRNALIVLGNVAAASPETLGRAADILRDYVAHRDPVLRVHAVWAAGRLGLVELMPTTDPHPDVQAEIDEWRLDEAPQSAHRELST